MANTGKARRTAITKTETIDGVAKPAVTYSMLQGPPAGTQTPLGWNPLASLTVARMSSADYKSAFTSFMGVCGVPAAVQTNLLANAEYYDYDACPIWSYTGHKSSGRYPNATDAYNLGSTMQYSLFSPSGEFTTGQPVGPSGAGSTLSDGFYQVRKDTVPGAIINLEVRNGLVYSITLGDPNASGPGDGGDGPVIAP